LNGSLWYGDLPALDGARDDLDSRTARQSREGALNTPKAHGSGTVLDALSHCGSSLISVDEFHFLVRG
jgi:hypothetical protein